MTLSDQITLIDALIQEDADVRVKDFWKELKMRERIENREKLKTQQLEALKFKIV